MKLRCKCAPSFFFLDANVLASWLHMTHQIGRWTFRRHFVTKQEPVAFEFICTMSCKPKIHYFRGWLLCAVVFAVGTLLKRNTRETLFALLLCLGFNEINSSHFLWYIFRSERKRWHEKAWICRSQVDIIFTSTVLIATVEYISCCKIKTSKAFHWIGHHRRWMLQSMPATKWATWRALSKWHCKNSA